MRYVEALLITIKNILFGLIGYEAFMKAGESKHIESLKAKINVIKLSLTNNKLDGFSDDYS